MNFTQELIKRQKEFGRPVRVGLAGAGQMGSGLAAQIGRIPGIIFTIFEEYTATIFQ